MRIQNRRMVIGLLLLLLLLAVTPAAAQNYRFAVDQMDMQVFVQPDASARIVYDITFSNQPGAHVIDIVDIGMPHEDYDLSQISASVDGSRVTDIRPSEFVDPGVEIHHPQPRGPTRCVSSFHQWWLQCARPSVPGCGVLCPQVA